MKQISRRSLIAALSVLGILPSIAHAHDEKEHIVELLKEMFEKPDNPLDVAPVVVRGDNAIAGWVQGDKGGRALLWKKEGTWQLRLCSGDALKNADMLVNANINAEDAKAMVAELAKGEAELDPAVVAKFSTFEGTMVMDGSAGQSQ
jgi:periplasmic copper chaperone A